MRFQNKIRIISICLIIICIVTFSGCNNESKFEYISKFRDYGEDFITNGIRIELPSGQVMTVDLLTKEDSYSPKVIFKVSFWTDDARVKWVKTSTEIKINDLIFLGDKVVAFAKNENWDNDYYLYINVWLLDDFGDEIYDYEKSLLYISEYDERIMEMYDQFNSIDRDEVAKTEAGIAFLLKNDLGKIVHGEFEKDWLSDFSISIIDGEYKEYNRDKAIIAD